MNVRGTKGVEACLLLSDQLCIILTAAMSEPILQNTINIYFFIKASLTFDAFERYEPRLIHI